MEALRLEALQRSFDQGPPAVNQVFLSVAPGSFFCLLGPSGCGKTTLLKLIGGYLKPNQGQIFIAGQNMTRQPPERREVGMVFQNYALFPHLSARENVAFGLEVRRVPRRERQIRVESMLDRVGLSMAERERRPRELSGGQQQRVALARALAIKPKVLLLDEPFANLDRQLRERLRTELRDIQRQTGVTTILVTHDQDEALALADQVGLMLAGRFLQIDTPQGIYQHPLTPFAARFVGEANLFQVMAVEADQLRLRGGAVLKRDNLLSVVPENWLLVRPEDCLVGAEAEHCQNAWLGRLISSTFLGLDQLLELEIVPGTTLRVRGRPKNLPEISSNKQLWVGIPSPKIWVIPGDDPPWITNFTAGSLSQ